jgi:hypothetical protein
MKHPEVIRDRIEYEAKLLAMLEERAALREEMQEAYDTHPDSAFREATMQARANARVEKHLDLHFPLPVFEEDKG